MRKRTARLRLCALVAIALGALGALAGAARVDAMAFTSGATLSDAGYRDHSFGATAPAPTAKDQQSKVWFNDGLWWGSLFNKTTLKYDIYKLDWATQAWSDTGVVVDERDGSRSDAFWDGSKLYIVTHGLTDTNSGHSIRVLRFSYDASTKTYSRDAGFPATLNSGGTAAATIDKDTTGTVWVTYTQTSKVYVTHSTTSEATWAAPYVLPVASAANLLDQDEAAVVSYNGKIGVMWSNQNPAEWAFYFAVHNDGDADNVWTRTTAHSASEESDNHMNVKALDGDAAGQVFAAVKTSLNAGAAPLYYLLVLKNDGTWAKHTFATVADDHTRAQVAVDPVNRKLYMFGSSPCCSGGAIYYKETSLDAISFASGRGSPLIANSTDTHINNASTTKQPLSDSSDLLAEASDDTSDSYVHGTIDIGPDTTPPDTIIDSGPAGTIADQAATFTFSANAAGATFACSLDGAAFASCTPPKTYSSLVDGAHTFQVRATDPAGNVDLSPATRTWTVDMSSQKLTVAGEADTYVEQGKPTTNFGTSSLITADDSPNTEGYIRFSVNGLTGAVGAAKLRLFASNGSTNGPALYRTATSWSETAVTWNTKPAATGSLIEDKAVIASRTWVEYDVSSVVTANGTYSFKLDPTSTDSIDFTSRESTGANKPELVLTIDSDTAPPDTTIDSGPTGTVASTSATLTFSSNDAGATFECRLDGAPYASCASPKTYASVGDGSHTFDVRAVDAAGNADGTPASRTWTIDSAPPAAPAITTPAEGSTNTSGSVTVAGTAEASSSIDVLEGGVWRATTTADATGHWSVALTGVGDGSHTYTATATDEAGNKSAVSNARTVTVDTRAPETTVDAGPTGTTSSTSATITFSSSDAGATFDCSLDGAAFAACTSPKAYTGLADGLHTFSVRAVDAVGNADQTPASRTWTVDTTPPAAPAITSPADNTATNSAAVTVSGTAEASATIEVFDGASSAGTTSANAAGSWSVVLAGVAAGSHTYTAKATDAVGNTSAASTATTVIVDMTAPETTIDSGPTGTSTNTTATFTFSSTETPSTFECSLDDGAFGSCATPRTYDGLAEGPHSFDVRAVDAAGNADASAATRTWTVDATVPQVSSVAPAAGATGVLVNSSVEATFSEPMEPSTVTGGTFTLVEQGSGSGVPATVTYDAPTRKATLDPNSALAAGTTYTATIVGGSSGTKDLAGSPLTTDTAWSFTTEAAPDTDPPETTIDSGPSGLTGTASATFTFSSDEANTTFQCKLDTGAYTSCTSPHSLASLGEGSHTLRVKATDVAGNTDSTPATRTWTVDTVAPAAPVITSPAADTTTSSTSVTLSGSAEDDITVEVFDGAASKGTMSTGSSGTWTLSLTGVADGAHTYTAKATDAAGNTSPASPVRTVTVDTTPPDTTIDSGPSGATASTSATFAFSASESGTTFECKLDGGAFSSCSPPKAYSGLAESSHTFEVRATDAAGNTDPSPASRAWTADVTAPAAPSLTSPADNSTNTSGTVTVAGTAEAGSTIEVFDGATSQGTVVADAAGAWTKTISGVTDGSHTYTAKSKDAAGNTSPSSGSRTVAVDATAPETTIDLGPSGTVTSTSATFAFSSNDGGATFACSLDGAAFESCTSPRTYTALAETSHTFQVRATDANGNTDATPASRSWTVDSGLFSDGFESGSFSAWTSVLTGGDGTATVQTATVKTGGFAAQLSETAAAGSFAYARKQLDARTELRVKGDFMIQTEGVSGGNVPLIRLFDTAGTRIISLYRQNLDADKIRVTHSGIGVTTTGRLALNTWGNLELHVIVAGTSASTVEVFLDGTLVYQTTTASLGTNGVVTVQIGNETKAQAFKLIADNIAVRP